MSGGAQELSERVCEVHLWPVVNIGAVRFARRRILPRALRGERLGRLRRLVSSRRNSLIFIRIEGLHVSHQLIEQ